MTKREANKLITKSLPLIQNPSIRAWVRSQRPAIADYTIRLYNNSLLVANPPMQLATYLVAEAVGL